MKCSKECLWAEIEGIVPHAKKSEMSLPAALKEAALNLFLLGEHANDSYRAELVREAVIESRDNGFLEFIK